MPGAVVPPAPVVAEDAEALVVAPLEVDPVAVAAAVVLLLLEPDEPHPDATTASAIDPAS